MWLNSWTSASATATLSPPLKSSFNLSENSVVLPSLFMITAQPLKYHRRKRLRVNSQLIFALLLLINLLPVFMVQYFFTGDGPSHLYNSNLILQLLGDDSAPAHSFFHLKWELIPNLGGHLLLALFNYFLPARIAEQLVFAMAMAGTAIGFRFLLRGLQKGVIWGSFLIFPLLHHFSFYIGFQSFCLGLALMLFSLGYYVRIRQQASFLQLAVMSALLLFTALFHLFPALVALLVIALWHLLQFSYNRKTSWPLLLASLPTLLLCGYFLLQNHKSAPGQWPSPLSLVMDILRARPLITIDTAEETMSRIFALLLLLPLSIAIYRHLRQQLPPWSKILLLTALLLLGLCFVAPDQMASGGFISIRLLTTFFIFLALWLAYCLPRRKWMFVPVLLMVAFNLWQVRYHFFKATELDADARALNAVTTKMDEGSTVLPLNYSYHWLHYNIGCYLGAEKELIVLDNYEADKSHFPVRWNEGMAPDGRLGDFAYSKRPLLTLAPYEQQSGQVIDYVVLWGHQNNLNDSATTATMALLKAEFAAIHSASDGKVKVFKRRPSTKNRQ